MMLTGIIRNVHPEEKYGTFRKTVLWITEVGKQYNNTWSIEFWNDDGAWLRGYSTGQMVNVNIAIIGRLSEKNGEEKVFNTLRGIKIQKIK